MLSEESTLRERDDIHSYVFLRLTKRQNYWRVAAIFRDRILWRTYQVSDYGEAESVINRCIDGLVAKGLLDSPRHARWQHRLPGLDAPGSNS